MHHAVGLSVRALTVRLPWPRERVAAVAIIAVAVVIRLAYLTTNCPLNLAADEAHYWDWSRHLDWSYYSKGPMVAWLIRLSCELFGSMSERLVGSPMLAVRLPAILCHVGLLTAGYVLTMQVTRNERKALVTVAVSLSLPIIAAGGTLMTIDAPYACCWAWALVFGHAAMIRGRNWAWPALGLTIGIGILAKYTMVVWLPCAGFFLLTCRTHRHILWRPGFWVASAIATLCCIPILIWNIQHDWITFRHVTTQAAGEADRWRWLGPFRFIGEQAGVLLFFWFVAWVSAMIKNRPGQARDPGRLYLWWMSAPVFGIFLFASLRSAGQLNWPIAAYISGLVLAVDWVVDDWARATSRHRRFVTTNLVVATMAGLILTGLTHYPQLMRPALAAISGQPTKDNPTPLRKYDPTARLRGWHYLAKEVDKICSDIRSQGEEPIIATAFWTLPAELAVYCADHPPVYCFGAALRQRQSQYDLWRPNPTWDPDQFAGRTVVYVGDVAPEVAAAFEHLEQTRYVEYSEGGYPLVYWNVTIGRGYRGFGSPDKWPGQRRY